MRRPWVPAEVGRRIDERVSALMAAAPARAWAEVTAALDRHEDRDHRSVNLTPASNVPGGIADLVARVLVEGEPPARVAGDTLRLRAGFRQPAYVSA